MSLLCGTDTKYSMMNIFSVALVFLQTYRNVTDHSLNAQRGGIKHSNYSVVIRNKHNKHSSYVDDTAPLNNHLAGPALTKAS
jgi:hypothetical protein